MGIGDHRPGAEVDLGHIAGLEVEHRGGSGIGCFHALQIPADRGVAPGEAVFAYQRLVDGCTLDAVPLCSEGDNIVSLNNYGWKQHCRGLFQLPVAA